MFISWWSCDFIYMTEVSWFIWWYTVKHVYICVMCIDMHIRKWYMNLELYIEHVIYISCIHMIWWWIKKSKVTITGVMATVLHGTYRLLRSRLYVSHIRSRLLSDIYGADSMVGHIRSWPHTHDSFKGMWNYRRYIVNCSLYKRKKKLDACMHSYSSYTCCIFDWYIIYIHWIMIKRKVHVRMSTNRKYMINKHFLTLYTNRKYILYPIFSYSCFKEYYFQLFSGIVFKSKNIRTLMYIHWVATH